MTRLLIDEHIRPDSAVAHTWLRADDGRVAIDADDGPLGVLSEDALLVVLRRYGRPLDDALALDLAAAPRLDLAGGRAILRLHWRAAVDAAARDWLVLVEPDRDPVAALAPGVAAALRYLAARLTGERDR